MSPLRLPLVWFTAAVVSGVPLAAQSASPASDATVSVHDLDSNGVPSKQQILTDIVTLAKTRKQADSLTIANMAPDTLVRSGIGDEAVNSPAARARVIELETELQKVMTLAEINVAVRSYNQFTSSSAKLKTTTDFQDAMRKPSKRSDVIRALADRIDRATNEKEMADARGLLSALEATPLGTTNLVEFLLQAQSSDALTGACASLILSRLTLAPPQTEQMMQALSKQRIATTSDPIVQHLVDYASELVSTPKPRTQ